MYRDNYGRLTAKDIAQGVAVFVGLVAFWVMIYLGEVYIPSYIEAHTTEAIAR